MAAWDAVESSIPLKPATRLKKFYPLPWSFLTGTRGGILEGRHTRMPKTLSRTHIQESYAFRFFGHCPDKTLKTKTTDTGEISLGPGTETRRNAFATYRQVSRCHGVQISAVGVWVDRRLERWGCGAKGKEQVLPLIITSCYVDILLASILATSGR